MSIATGVGDLPNGTIRSPESVLCHPGCIAQVLSVSDQHATVLLTTETEQSDSSPEKSLLKLTVVPFHRGSLSVGKRDEETEQSVGSNSASTISFLSNYEFRLTSESGAEYSYYEASPKETLVMGLKRLLQSSVSGWMTPGASTSLSLGAFKAELISPASERQVQRAMPSPSMVMIEETPEIYEAVTKPYIQSRIDGGGLSWIQNIVNGTKERERLLLDADDYILNIDTKWRSHPDANATSRDMWYGHASVADLYCLAIVKESGIASVRELRAKHLPMLRSILDDSPRVIEQIYGVPRNQLRIFVHYHPQFYHLHVHFTRLANEFGCQVERGHLLSDIIQNLELDGEFYVKRTLSFKLPITDDLCQRIQIALKGDTHQT